MKILKTMGETTTFLSKETVKKSKHAKYSTNVISFDIETTSTYFKGKKFAYMYAWATCINGESVYIGRTWKEFLDYTELLRDYLDLNDDNRLIIWVHNLSYEFQFLSDLFNWSNVFCVDNRTPVKACTVDGIEFRCSYILSGYSLDDTAKYCLFKHNIRKLYGSLDYGLIHNPSTKLSQKETDYLIHDVEIVAYYIQEQIEEYKNIVGLPLTNTGRVRMLMRKACLTTRAVNKKTGKMVTVRNKKYYDLMRNLTLTPDEYLQLKRAYAGGFTHANAINNGIKIDDVTSYDFTSSYPAVMLSEQFPMSKGKLVEIKTKKDLDFYIKNYCCLFDVELNNIRENPDAYDNPISYSKCKVEGKYTLNNGRIVKADKIITTITDVDYKVIRAFYTYDTMKVKNFRVYKKGYLPKEFILVILDLYKAKTELKDVPERQQEYQNKKGMLNSTYGMCCTDPAKDEIVFENGEWYLDSVNLNEVLEQYNKSQSRTLFYPWGVWITAYARRNLFTAVYTIKDDYIYSDTDSVKIKNVSDYISYFDHYNQVITRKIDACLKFYGIDPEASRPKTVTGKTKQLGVWDFDGHYKHFKTLGAKRYICTYDDDSLHITIAGLGKEKGCEYLSVQKDPYECFNDLMDVPADKTGKLTHTYVDSNDVNNFVKEADITDYLGNTDHIEAVSYVHLEKAPFRITVQEDLKEYIIQAKAIKKRG